MQAQESSARPWAISDDIGGGGGDEQQVCFVRQSDVRGLPAFLLVVEISDDGFRERVLNGWGVMKRCASAVMTTRTLCPAWSTSSPDRQALWAAIEPVTPRTMFLLMFSLPVLIIILFPILIHLRWRAGL